MRYAVRTILLVAIIVLGGCKSLPTPDPQIPEELPANANKIAIELGAGNVLIDNVRTTSDERTVVITRNPQDVVTIIDPPIMTSGLHVDQSTLPPLDPGYGEQRVKDTTQEPQAGGGGQFRTTCEVAWVADVDPVVYPGAPGRSHTHTGFGNVELNAFSTHDSLFVKGNTACRGGRINHSAYWIPTLLDTRTSKPILPYTINVYYKNFGFDRLSIEEFPAGLRMVTGDPNATKPQPNNSSMAHSWQCNGVMYTSIPTDQVACPPGSDLTVAVFFNNCWDGNNLDSPDHKSHMANGPNKQVPGSNPPVYKKACPSTHPHVLPQLSFQMVYTVTDTRYMRFVSDTNPAQPAGWTMHGDVISAWEPKFMRMWVNNCLRAGAECFSHLLGRDPDDGKLKQIY